ncbi:hypothetical protein Pmani_029453 [Petrolisthes manimaculis]|uniref:Uncharacterized protein n=1 Tax=Petrolisthes manimaculis TaxID=1843537 RepID=A0AAE1NXH9_9EUCA|nr:hypothetical protein Pmani_029453 [Petrolisthes manimaculis]
MGPSDGRVEELSERGGDKQVREPWLIRRRRKGQSDKASKVEQTKHRRKEGRQGQSGQGDEETTKLINQVKPLQVRQATGEGSEAGPPSGRLSACLIPPPRRHTAGVSNEPCLSLPKPHPASSLPYLSLTHSYPTSLLFSITLPYLQPTENSLSNSASHLFCFPFYTLNPSHHHPTSPSPCLTITLPHHHPASPSPCHQFTT